LSRWAPAMLSVPFFLHMSPDAGAEVSGHGKLAES
jgi:hypothetical protein